MNKVNITKVLGTLVSILLAGAAVRYPAYAGWLAGFSGNIFGWLHLPQPQSVPQLPAATKEEQ